jgi:hypothetical protein
MPAPIKNARLIVDIIQLLNLRPSAARSGKMSILKQGSICVLARAFAIMLISFCSAYAIEIPCRDLATADADELLATVAPQSIQYGGGVRVGKSGCDIYPGQKVCEWEQTLEDDQMLDRDHRLIYVRSSHQSGSGSWQDLLVFGCVSGRVKKVFLGQFGRDTTKEEIFDRHRRRCDRRS